MRSPRNLVVMLIVLGVTVTGLGLAVRADDPKPEATKAESFKPVQQVEQMMHGQDKLFREIKSGIVDKAWDDASNSAWLLAEIANVNQYQNTNEDYKGWAKSMSDDLVKLAGALKKRDADESKKLMSQVGQTCSACHNKYKK